LGLSTLITRPRSCGTSEWRTKPLFYWWLQNRS